MIEIENCFFQLSISTTIAIATGAPDLNQFIENIIRPQKIRVLIYNVCLW